MSDVSADAGATATMQGEAPRRDRRRLVIGARVALMMTLVADVAVLALGVATLLLLDPPEMDGWLRSAFGTAFGYIALGIAAALGIPSAIGVWAMSGAAAADAVPALAPATRRAVVLTAVMVVLSVAVIILVRGRGVTLLDLGAIGLIALFTLGLAGAAAFSPHRGRAILAAGVSVLVWLGSVWFVSRALPDS